MLLHHPDQEKIPNILNRAVSNGCKFIRQPNWIRTGHILSRDEKSIDFFKSEGFVEKVNFNH